MCQILLIKIELNNLNIQVYSDKKWLEFILNQIINNAIKYVNQDPVITISAKKYQDHDELMISDNGIGILKDEIDRVFDKGFTGYNGRTDKKATGLGLYLCKNILDKLSHKISIESEVGVKTKVILDLAMVNVNIE